MSNIRYQNEKIKRKYFDYCREALGFTEKTLKVKESALWRYDEFVKHQDYKRFNSETAKAFKKWLEIHKKVRDNIPLDKTTQYNILRNLRVFFIWLSTQAGYKSRIHTDDIEYLHLNKADTKIAISSKEPKYPSLNYIQKLCCFEIKNEIDQRDRALIAFTALSGMRDLAIVSLPFGCFLPDDLLVTQDPAMGVKTKFTKTIYTTLFKFDNKLLKYVLDWYKYLKEEKLFDNLKPLFPSTNIELMSKTQHSFISTGISKEFWSDAGPMRKMFKARAQQMGLEYYSPHKFRHFAIREASDHAVGPEQMKAISQNVGHERIATTFFSYGAIDTHRVASVINDLDFGDRNNK